MIKLTRRTVGTRYRPCPRVRPSQASLTRSSGVAIQVSQTRSTKVTTVSTYIRVVTRSTQRLLVVTRCGRILVVVVEATRTYRALHRCLRRSEVANITIHTRCARITVVIVLASSTRRTHCRANASILARFTGIAHRRRIAVQIGPTSHTCCAVRPPSTRVLTSLTVNAWCRRLAVPVTATWPTRRAGL